MHSMKVHQLSLTCLMASELNFLYFIFNHCFFLLNLNLFLCALMSCIHQEKASLHI